MQNKQRNRVILWRFPKSPLTLLLGELVQQTGLAHAHVADDDVLEDVVVVVRTACHFDGNCASNRETKQQIIHISRCQHCLGMIHKCKVWASVCWWMRNPHRQWEICVYDERTIALALTVIEQSVCPPIEAGYHFHVGVVGRSYLCFGVWKFRALRTNARLRMGRVAAFRGGRFVDVEISVGRYIVVCC